MTLSPLPTLFRGVRHYHRTCMNSEDGGLANLVDLVSTNIFFWYEFLAGVTHEASALNFITSPSTISSLGFLGIGIFKPQTGI